MLLRFVNTKPCTNHIHGFDFADVAKWLTQTASCKSEFDSQKLSEQCVSLCLFGSSNLPISIQF